MRNLAWLNGVTIDLDKAYVSMEDRGFLLGDGVYEAVRIYNGTAFLLKEHLKRLLYSAGAIMLDLPVNTEKFETIIEQLIEDSACREGYLYIQLTRGVSPRAHAFPENTAPTLAMYVRGISEEWEPKPHIFKYCITYPDERGLRCDIKSINRLHNVLAKERAKREGALEAILYRPDGTVTEGSSANVFAVIDGDIYTHPETTEILSGITRGVVLELLHEHKIACFEKTFSIRELAQASEIWITSSIIEVATVIIDKKSNYLQRKPSETFKKIVTSYSDLVYKCCYK